MAMLSNPASFWFQRTGFPNRLFETGSNDYELYEEDDEFVLGVELPGFDPAEIDVAWDDGVLNVVAESEDDDRGERRTYHRRFRFPKDVDDDAITAEYDNGILEVRLPVVGSTARGTEIEIES